MKLLGCEKSPADHAGPVGKPVEAGRPAASLRNHHVRCSAMVQACELLSVVIDCTREIRKETSSEIVTNKEDMRLQELSALMRDMITSSARMHRG